ncbi:hypothetical protein ZWY2020_052032 [Hordeum vulgare]|nr:hypothetical protein ZWY2020_052032 [Hordeum vulgare]
MDSHDLHYLHREMGATRVLRRREARAIRSETFAPNTFLEETLQGSSESSRFQNPQKVPRLKKMEGERKQRGGKKLEQNTAVDIPDDIYLDYCTRDDEPETMPKRKIRLQKIERRWAKEWKEYRFVTPKYAKKFALKPPGRRALLEDQQVAHPSSLMTLDDYPEEKERHLAKLKKQAETTVKKFHESSAAASGAAHSSSQKPQFRDSSTKADDYVPAGSSLPVEEYVKKTPSPKTSKVKKLIPSASDEKKTRAAEKEAKKRKASSAEEKIEAKRLKETEESAPLDPVPLNVAPSFEMVVVGDHTTRADEEIQIDDSPQPHIPQKETTEASDEDRHQLSRRFPEPCWLYAPIRVNKKTFEPIEGKGKSVIDEGSRPLDGQFKERDEYSSWDDTETRPPSPVPPRVLTTRELLLSLHQKVDHNHKWVKRQFGAIVKTLTETQNSVKLNHHYLHEVIDRTWATLAHLKTQTELEELNFEQDFDWSWPPKKKFRPIPVPDLEYSSFSSFRTAESDEEQLDT